MEVIKKLDDRQVKDFDTDYIQGKDWEDLKDYLSICFPSGRFTFLDIGGGNGVFCDKVLAGFPKAQAVLLDNSEYLISLNRTQDNKVIICDSVENISSLFQTEKFDVIFLNLVLHHFVGNNYRLTYNNVVNVLESLKPLLSEKGRVYIMEDVYNGLLFDGLPSHLIYSLTSNKKIAKITKRFGANTAGVGVCFRSKKQWKRIFDRCGFDIIKTEDSERFKFSLPKVILLHLGKVGMQCFWLKKKKP
jgi:ubiquinone/menaquinone biosynthesis C-methylase UbiE